MPKEHGRQAGEARSRKRVLRHVRGRGANGPRKEATGCRPETSCDLNDDMVRLLGGVGDGGEDIVPLETGIVRQDFLD